MSTPAPLLRRIDLRGQVLDAMALRAVVPRADVDVAAALAAVAPICEDVRARGVPALLELTERFDGVHAEDVRVPAHALTDALAALDPDVRAGLEESIRRARLVATDQLRGTTTTEVVPGGRVSERWVPVGRVGCTCPVAGRSTPPASS